MKDDNPYAPVSTTVTADGADQPRPSLLRVVAMLSAAAVFGLFLLWSASGVYFTLHPAALQSGNQVAPASFESSDYPMLVAWSTAAAAFAVALIWSAVGTVSALRRLLGQWRSAPGQPR